MANITNTELQMFKDIDTAAEAEAAVAAAEADAAVAAAEAEAAAIEAAIDLKIKRATELLELLKQDENVFKAHPNWLNNVAVPLPKEDEPKLTKKSIARAIQMKAYGGLLVIHTQRLAEYNRRQRRIEMLRNREEKRRAKYNARRTQMATELQAILTELETPAEGGHRRTKRVTKRRRTRKTRRTRRNKTRKVSRKVRLGGRRKTKRRQRINKKKTRRNSRKINRK